jgi:hypothetical protein
LRRRVECRLPNAEGVVEKEDVNNTEHKPTRICKDHGFESHSKPRDDKQTHHRVRHKKSDISNWIPEHAPCNTSDKAMIIFRDFPRHPALLRIQSKFNSTLDVQCTPKNEENERVQNGREHRGHKYREKMEKELRFQIDRPHAAGKPICAITGTEFVLLRVNKRAGR